MVSWGWQAAGMHMTYAWQTLQSGTHAPCAASMQHANMLSAKTAGIYQACTSQLSSCTSKMTKVDLEKRLPNQGPVPGSLLTPSLMSRRNWATCSSLPGLASRWIRYDFCPGVSACKRLLQQRGISSVQARQHASDHPASGSQVGEEGRKQAALQGTLHVSAQGSWGAPSVPCTTKPAPSGSACSKLAFSLVVQCLQLAERVKEQGWACAGTDSVQSHQLV